jgi:hypothetical protein
MADERRKSPRFKCLLPAELVKSESSPKLVERVTIQDISNEGIKLVVKFAQLIKGSDMDLKLYVPEKSLLTFLTAEIAWSKYSNSKLEAGLRIKEIDRKIKEEILNWLYPKWLEEEKKGK